MDVGVLICVGVVSVSALVVAAVLVAEKQSETGDHLSGDSQFWYSNSDELSVEEARIKAGKIFAEFGFRVDASPHPRKSELNSDVAEIACDYEFVTFDGLTRQLDFSTVHTVEGYTQIGVWPSGEKVFCRAGDNKIYIEESPGSLELLASSVFHYILKAKVESDMADSL